MSYFISIVLVEMPHYLKKNTHTQPQIVILALTFAVQSN